ncbi:MAG TPA: threonine--tRNA ligase, partial [Candidatus Hydrogenedentes bacterium]|nr:threonine--tRNA ligase [Candidatus Hydrogenedentota bacterium]
MNQALEDIADKKETQIYRLRHSLSHILAAAVRQMRPEAKLAFGPPVENGFYYDFDFGNSPLGEADLEEVERHMNAIVKEHRPFIR